MINKNYLGKILLSAILTSLPFTSTTAEVKWLDRTVAVVDDEAVLLSELDARLKSVRLNLSKNKTQAPPENILRAQVLDQLILESIQTQMATRMGALASDTDVNQAMLRIAANNKMSLAQFSQQIKKEGQTLQSVKAQVRSDLTLQRIQEGIVQRNVQISEREVDNFLNSEQGKFWAAPDYKLGHILIPVNQSAGNVANDKAKAQAEKIIDLARKGSDFKKLALTYSKGQNALKGGELGWRKPAQLPRQFSETLHKLKAGDISQAIRSAAGYHILKVYQLRGGAEKHIQQSKVRHILLKTNVLRDDKQAQKELNTLRTKISNGEDFKTLAKEHSEDIGSALQGGDLGWSMPGMFVPEFEATMKKTPSTKMSAPFKSQFGWHLLLVEERRKQDFTEKFIRNQASNLIGQRKYEEELQNWLQKIRDEAYIEIKL